MTAFSVKDPAPYCDGKLEESYGRAFHTLVEVGRFYANQLGQVVPGLEMEDLPKLRASPEGMSSLRLINSRMYSYWQAGPVGSGVCDLLAKQYHAAQKDMVKGCARPGCDRKPSDGGPKLQACSACRVPYYCSKECQQADWPSHKKNCKLWRKTKSQSFQDVRLEKLPADTQVMRHALAADVRFWGYEEHRITGTFYLVRHTEEGMLLLKAGSRNEATEPVVYLALGISESIAAALERGGRKLPLRADLTLLPFMGRLVYDGLMAAGPPGNQGAMMSESQLEALVQQAYARGSVVSCLQLPDEPPLPREAAGGPDKPVAAAELSPAAHKALKAVAAAPKDRNERTQMWVCRRFGYTREENPDNMAMFMAGPVPVRGPPIRSERLEYTGEELLRGLAKGVKAMGVAPRLLAIDCKPALLEVEDELCRIGIEAGYYPPPSAEERRIFGS